MVKVVINRTFGGFSLSDEALAKAREYGWPPKYDYSNSPEDRCHPALVRAVEELGCDEASGRYAKLEIVEIPDGVEFEIGEYDGFEKIHETHRSWP